MIEENTEKEKGDIACDHCTLLAGSSKLVKHDQGNRKRGRKAMVGSMMQEMGSMMQTAIAQLGVQRMEQAARDTAECDKDRTLFLETIKMLLNRGREQIRRE